MIADMMVDFEKDVLNPLFMNGVDLIVKMSSTDKAAVMEVVRVVGLGTNNIKVSSRATATAQRLVDWHNQEFPDSWNSPMDMNRALSDMLNHGASRIAKELDQSAKKAKLVK